MPASVEAADQLLRAQRAVLPALALAQFLPRTSGKAGPRPPAAPWLPAGFTARIAARKRFGAPPEGCSGLGAARRQGRDRSARKWHCAAGRGVGRGSGCRRRNRCWGGWALPRSALRLRICGCSCALRVTWGSRQSFFTQPAVRRRRAHRRHRAASHQKSNVHDFIHPRRQGRDRSPALAAHSPANSYGVCVSLGCAPMCQQQRRRQRRLAIV